MSDWYVWDRQADTVSRADSLRAAQVFSYDRTVARTTLRPFFGVTVEVSTVFLSLDHRFAKDKGEPLVFETMVFGGPMDGHDWRWSTPQGARAGHEEVVHQCSTLRFRVRCAWWLLFRKLVEAA